MLLKKILLVFVILIIQTSISLAGKGVYLSFDYGFGKTYGNLANKYSAGRGLEFSVGYRFNKLIALELEGTYLNTEPDSAQGIMVDDAVYLVGSLNLKFYPTILWKKFSPFVSVGYGNGSFHWDYRSTYTRSYGVEQDWLNSDPIILGLGIDYEISNRFSVGANFRYLINFFDSRSNRLNLYEDAGNTVYFTSYLTFYCCGCK